MHSCTLQSFPQTCCLLLLAPDSAGGLLRPTCLNSKPPSVEQQHARLDPATEALPAAART